jgi:predicted nucleotidyltransferase
MLIELLRNKRDEILRIAAKHGAHNVRVFGSVARRDDDDKSDIDLLVDMDEDASLLDHAALLVELEELLGRGVDVAPASELRPRVRERVLKEAIPI